MNRTPEDADGGHLSVAGAVSTGITLASSVEAAHRLGSPHPDIRPGHTDEDDSPAWTAPEVLDGRSAGSVGADVYSLGATVWTLLAGRSPFSIPGGDDSPRAMAARILHASRPRTERPDVPPELEELVARCLAKDPGQRPASAMELALALLRIERDQGWPETPVSFEGESLEPGSIPRPARHEAASAPVIADAGARPTPPRPRRTLSPATGWTVGLVLLVVVAGGLAWRAASADDRSPAPGGVAPTTETTGGAPGVVPPPIVLAHRAGGSVAYRWHASDAPRAGDSYEWRIPGRGGAPHLTNGVTLDLSAVRRTCIRVRLIRPGLAPSAWASACA